MGLIKYLIEANTLCALNNINNAYAKERKKQKHLTIIRKAITNDKEFSCVGTYIILVKSAGHSRYFKFHWSAIDKVTNEIYDYVILSRTSLYELSFQHELVRIK